jgi:hypothetical protein
VKAKSGLIIVSFLITIPVDPGFFAELFPKAGHRCLIEDRGGACL